MKKIKIEIINLFASIIILIAGASLTFRFLDGRMLLGILLLLAGAMLLIRWAVSK